MESIESEQETRSARLMDAFQLLFSLQISNLQRAYVKVAVPGAGIGSQKSLGNPMFAN